MPLTSRPGEASGGWEQGTSDTGSMQILVADYPTPLPASIVASGSWISGPMIGDGYPRICIGLVMDHGGTLNVHRYVDLAATIERPIGTNTVAIVAATPLILDVSDMLPFLTYQVEIVNAAGATGNISKLVVLLSN